MHCADFLKSFHQRSVQLHAGNQCCQIGRFPANWAVFTKGLAGRYHWLAVSRQLGGFRQESATQTKRPLHLPRFLARPGPNNAISAAKWRVLSFFYLVYGFPHHHTLYSLPSVLRAKPCDTDF